MSSTAPESSAVYYKDSYWNDHPSTIEYLARQIDSTQSPARWWPDYFRKTYLAEPAELALVLNCGNGWVEREMIDKEIAKRVIAFDYSRDLLAQAQTAASGREILYVQADCNQIEFRENSFDLVVNVAAMHHVQYINRMHTLLVRALKPEGLFVNFDYVGPHRNQYPSQQFRLMESVNALLRPEFVKSPFHYPDLPAMLQADPTEAIHSELILETFQQFFYELERKDLGGGIAYQIMHNNAPLYERRLQAAGSAVQDLLTADELLTEIAQVPNLFSFYVGRPRKALLADDAHVQALQRAENEREDRAKQNGGAYDGFLPAFLRP